MVFPYSEIVLSLKQAEGPTKFVTLSDGDKLRISETASVFDRGVKLTVENTTSDDQLVHIRCSNHKYWTRTEEGIIAASADKPIEDVSSPNCTLFKPIMVEGSTTTRLVHHLGLNVAHKSCEDGAVGDCLTVEAVESVPATEFSIVDYSSLLKLPRRVSFKGINGKYLGYKNNVYNDLCYTEPGGTETLYLIYHTREGDIRVRCGYNNMFWILHDAFWIYSQAEEENNHPRTKFEVIKVDSKPNSIRLRNRGNNAVCRTKIEPGYEGWLLAPQDQPPESGTLEIVELYTERKIDVTEFRFDEATVYNLTDKVISSKTPWNKASVVRQSKLVFCETIQTRSGKWTNGPTFPKKPFNFSSKVPLIGSDLILFVVNEPVTQPYEWGEEVAKTQTFQDVYIVTVPKSSATVVQMGCKSGSYDIPFSYTQTDLYPDGTSETTLFPDGLYTGTNVYCVSFETQNLPTKPDLP